MTSLSPIDTMLQGLDEILNPAHASISDPAALEQPIANLEKFVENHFAELKSAMANNGISGDQRLHLAACLDRLVDLQAKTEARLQWFDALGADLAEILDRD